MVLVNEKDPMITSNYYRSFEYVTSAPLKEGPQTGRSLFVKNPRLRPDTDLQRISNLLEPELSVLEPVLKVSEGRSIHLVLILLLYCAVMYLQVFIGAKQYLAPGVQPKVRK